MKFIFTPKSLFVLLLVCGLQGFAQTTYYVSSTGNDANSGTSPATPWQTTAKVNSWSYAPGDSILFQGGQTFTGGIVLTGTSSGTATSPIVISSYGAGMATILEPVNDGIVLYDVQGITIRKLIVDGSDTATNTGSGLKLYNDLAQRMSNFNFDSLEIRNFRDIGVNIGTDIGSSPGYSNVRITHNSIHNIGNTGIFTYGFGDNYTNSDFYIGFTDVYNIFGLRSSPNTSGNGIIVSGVNGALIESSSAHNNGVNNNSNVTGGGPFGIWAYNSNNVTIQFSEAYNISSGASNQNGGGFDLDLGTQNSVIQYSYSHNNDGAGFSMNQGFTSNPYTNNTIRYNISQNDGRNNSYGAITLFSNGTTITNSRIFNNTVYLNNTGLVNGSVPSGVLILSNNLSKVAVNNNIFYLNGNNLPFVNAQQFADTNMIHFLNNDYYSQTGNNTYLWSNGTAVISYPTLAAWRAATNQEMNGATATGTNANPMLTAPGSGTAINPATGGHLATLTGYKLLAGSPMIDAGMNLAAMGAHDFYGVPIPQGARIDIGANEALALTPTPVRLVSFSGTILNDHSLLTWQVADETDMFGYEVQKSTDGAHFQSVGTVTASGSAVYTYPDYSYSSGTPQYYRLKMVNTDRTFAYSSILRLTNNAGRSAVTFVEGQGLIIHFSSNALQPATIRVFNAAGNELIKSKVIAQKGDNLITIPEANNWMRGMYIVRLSVDGQSFKIIR